MTPPSPSSSLGQLKLIQFNFSDFEAANANASKCMNEHSIDIGLVQDACCTKVCKLESYLTI